MMWGVHTMGPGMVGRNFLAWHRYYLLQLERRLQQVDSAVSLPYWDWIADPTPPTALSKPSDLTSWSVTRNFDPSLMPTSPELTAVMNLTAFARFQR